MTRSNLPAIRLNDESKAAIATTALRLPNPYDDIEDFLARLQRAIAELPVGVVRAVREFACDPAHLGYLLVSNLPIDDPLPPTPADGRCVSDKATFISETCLLGLGSLLGEPFAYRTEKSGELMHTVAPVRGSERKASNEGSELDFLPHTELAYFPFRPDHLVLYCLRADEDRVAATTVADVRFACARLPAEVLAGLRQSAFQIRAPQSFQACVGEAWSEPRPVLTGPDELPEACVNFNGIRALNTAAVRALEAFGVALQDPEVEACVCLEAGECLLIDNRKALHGRRRFTARFDGHDRWLQRIYTRTELWSGRTGLKNARRIFS